MFQMSKQLFNQCWPAIAARIEQERISRAAPEGTAAAPSPTAAAEAGYVLGVAMGYALLTDRGAGTPVSASVPRWRADACGGLNWPCIAPPRMPHHMSSRPA